MKHNLFFISLGVTGVIVYLSLMRMPKVQIEIKHVDKWYHSLAYFVLALCWLLTYYKKTKKKYIIVFACIALGIIIEALQMSLTNYRTGDYFDVIANTIGVFLALLVFNFFLRKKEIK